MADRYWVGGTGNWNSSSTTNWSGTSGGSGGASAPNISDNVFFDANSNGGVVTVIGSVLCLNVTTTGFTGSLAGQQPASINIYGNLILDCGFNTVNGPSIVFYGTTNNTCSITIPVGLVGLIKDNSAAETSLTSNLICSYINLNRGSLDLNDYNITGGFYTSGTNTRRLVLGSGTWSIPYTGSSGDEGQWNADASTNLTITPQTSTISLIGGGTAITQYFRGGGFTYYNLNISGNNAAGKTITGNNTFNSITNSTQPVLVKFTAFSTQTVNNFALTGTQGNLVTIQSASTSQFTLSSSNAQNVDYISIRDSNVVGSSWTAGYNSLNLGNNSGWIFTPRPSGFFVFF